MHARSSWPQYAAMLLGLAGAVDIHPAVAAAPGGSRPAPTGRPGEQPTSAEGASLAAVALAPTLLQADPPAGARGDERAIVTGHRRPIRVLIVNSGPHVIQAAYACAPRAATWGDNLLTQRALRPEQQTVIELADGCGIYNLRFVAGDGIEYLEDEVAFCTDREAAEAATDPRAYVILGHDDLRAVDAPSAPRPPAADDAERRPR